MDNNLSADQLAAMAKYPTARWKAAGSTKWVDSTNREVASAAAAAPPCGYAIWEWDGANWNEVENHCSSACKPDPPIDDGTPMDVGTQVSKDCVRK